MSGDDDDTRQHFGANAPLLWASDSHAQLSQDNTGTDTNIGIDTAREAGYSGGRFIWALTFSAGVSGLLFGYDTGVISSTLISIKSDLSNHPLSTIDKSLITSCTSLFALIASPLAGILADKNGRRRVILVADILFAVGALLQSFSTRVWGMIIGRSIIGLAIGGASLVTPLYISELAPSQLRGRLVTVSILFITGGQVVAYMIGWLFSTIPGGWRWMVGLGAIPAIFQFAVLALLPETPRWLVQAGFEGEARKVLLRIYHECLDCDSVAEQTLNRIRREVADEGREVNANKNSSEIHAWLRDSYRRVRDLFCVAGNRRALTIAVLLQGLQQLSGFNSLMYFSATIFSMLSFSSPTLTSLSVALTNFFFTLLAFSLIDRVGRRRILLFSLPVMTLALALCAIAFSSLNLPRAQSRVHVRDLDVSNHDDTFVPLAVLFCLTIYVASYAVGLGNIPWQQSELFPLNVRSIGSALATATNWGSNFIVGLTFLPMMELLSPGWTFAIYAAICAAGWTCIWRIYPEMNGLSLEEVGSLLRMAGACWKHEPNAAHNQLLG